MSFKIKLDESLSELVGAAFSREGYAVLSVRGQGWSGVKDPQLWPMVQAEGVFFVSADKGFGDVRVYAPGSHAGLLVLRADSESIVAYCDLVAMVLQRFRLEELIGCTVVASPRSVRIKRPASPPPTG